MNRIAVELEKVAAVRLRLEELKATDPELAHDTLEGQTDILEIMSWLLAKLGDEDYHQHAIGERIADLGVRKRDSEGRGERLRSLLAHCVEATGQSPIRLPEATLSLAARPPSAVVTDEAALPEEFWKVRREVSKSAINAAIKEGRDIPGVLLGNGGMTLSVRRK